MGKQFQRNKGRRGQQREEKEFEEEVIQIDRVTRVVKGGRRLRFRATVVIGDKRGRVGVGIGKSNEVTTAIKKASTKAQKDIIRVPITKNDSIPHQIKVKFKAAKILLLPAGKGTGIIAGGAIRKVVELAGIKNILSKAFGTNNRLSNAQAAIRALESLREIPHIAKDWKKNDENKAIKTGSRIIKKGEKSEVKTEAAAPKKKKEEEESIEDVKKKLINM
jgi:small subunit ribosomal protein S5